MDAEWARERVARLVGGAEPEDIPEMRVVIGELKVTVSGHGVALLIAPGRLPLPDDCGDKHG